MRDFPSGQPLYLPFTPPLRQAQDRLTKEGKETAEIVSELLNIYNPASQLREDLR